MDKEPQRIVVPLEVNVHMLLQSALEVGQSIAAILYVEFATTDNADVFSYQVRSKFLGDMVSLYVV